MVRLTERDESVLHALARFRLAQTSHVLAYAFADVRRDTATVRLRRLFDSQHLALLPPSQGAENIYRLGPAGSRLLRDQGIQVGRVPRGGLEHHLAIVDAWVSLAGIDGMSLERCLPDWELREQFAVRELPIIPDLFALIGFRGSIHAVAVEVDLGSENAAVLGRKMETYRSLWGRSPGLFGYERFGIVAASFNPARGSVVAAAVKKAWVVPSVHWERGESPSPVLRKLLGAMSGPLVAPPCGKGRVGGPGESDE